MKFSLVALALSWASHLPSKVGAVRAARVSSRASPVADVIKLLEDLKTSLEDEGTEEKEAYEKYEKWCEDTLTSKADEITETKDSIEEYQAGIVQLKGGHAVHGAQIKQLKKDIDKNIESRKNAMQLRDEEKDEYRAAYRQNEQCLQALEAAIRAVSGAGTGKKKGSELQESQLMSVVAGVRTVLALPNAVRHVSTKDLELMDQFMKSPGSFVGGDSAMSAVQLSNKHPYGDYSPKGTQVTGILKSLYDSFMHDLEKANGEEADREKSYQELLKTKKKEWETMTDSLEEHQKNEASKGRDMASDKMALDDAKKQLKYAEAFFARTKPTCQEKALQFEQRTKLRAQELEGVEQAIEILKSDAFKEEAPSFLQLAGSAAKRQQKAYRELRRVAAAHQSVRLAHLALKVKASSRGHFDEVMGNIDEMIALLRKEEMEDVKHRDFCQNKEKKNENDITDKNDEIEKAGKTVTKLGNKKDDILKKITELEGEIEKTNTSMGELDDLRKEEREDFAKAQSGVDDAVEAIDKAIHALEKFHASSGGFLQVRKVAPAATTAAPAARAAVATTAAPATVAPPAQVVSLAKAITNATANATGNATAKGEPEELPPSAPFADGNYAGSKAGKNNVVGLLRMIQDNMKNEKKKAFQAEVDAQDKYVKDKNALAETLHAYKQSLATQEKEVADLETEIADLEKSEEKANDDLAELEKIKEAIGVDCEWVKTAFDDRREKRKKEISGLIDAKNFLAGVDEGI